MGGGRISERERPEEIEEGWKKPERAKVDLRSRKRPEVAGEGKERLQGQGQGQRRQEEAAYEDGGS